MVHPPDGYTFKCQLVLRLPKLVFEYLLNKEITAEYSMVEAILYYARKAEENAKLRARYSNENRTQKTMKTVASNTPIKEVSTTYKKLLGNTQ